MNFAEQPPPPSRRIVGFGAVLLFHILLVYALVTGLATKVIDVVRAPIETKVIEEIKKPPPPPEVVLPPPPKMEAPPPPYIPPPEIQVANPPPAPSITVAPSPVPPAPVFTPTPPVAAAPVAAPAPPAPVTAGVACPTYAKAMGEAAFPREATRAGIEKGDAVIQFTVSASGEVKDVHALRSSNPIFARNSIRIVSSEFKCVGQGRDITVSVPFSYKVE